MSKGICTQCNMPCEALEHHRAHAPAIWRACIAYYEIPEYLQKTGKLILENGLCFRCGQRPVSKIPEKPIRNGSGRVKSAEVVKSHTQPKKTRHGALKRGSD